jgi:hypothetical protein
MAVRISQASCELPTFHVCSSVRRCDFQLSACTRSARNPIRGLLFCRQRCVRLVTVFDLQIHPAFIRPNDDQRMVVSVRLTTHVFRSDELTTSAFWKRSESSTIVKSTRNTSLLSSENIRSGVLHLETIVKAISPLERAPYAFNFRIF